jgi:hypothetical protein
MFQASLNAALIAKISRQYEASHKLGIIRGVVVCWQCAAYTVGMRSVLLAQPCTRRYAGRGWLLTALSKGKKLKQIRRWPDES